MDFEIPVFVSFRLYFLTLVTSNIFRHLSVKTKDEDHKYFVKYEGSAGRFEKGHFYLQLIMKKYRHSLQWIVKNGKLTDEKKAKYAKAAARGLRFVHKHQVMHRDVKLSNYLVGQMIILNKPLCN